MLLSQRQRQRQRMLVATSPYLCWHTATKARSPESIYQPPVELDTAQERRNPIRLNTISLGVVTRPKTPDITPADFTRTALAPGILGAIALFVGLALLESDTYLFVRFAVSILAIIVAVFAWQASQWWWLVGLAPIAVIWNPAWVIELGGQGWVAIQYIAALILIVAGVMIKVPKAS